MIEPEKLILIDKLEEKAHNGANDYPLIIHAVLSSIPIRTLISYCLETKPTYQRAVSNVVKRLQGYINPSEIFEWLWSLLNDASYLQRSKIRKFLIALLPRLTKDQQTHFFLEFVNSQFTYDVNAAFKMCNLIWDENFSRNYFNLFLENKSNYLLEYLIEACPAKDLAEVIEEIWLHISLERLKYKCAKKIATVLPDRLEFLKEIEPLIYLYIISNYHLDLKMSDAFALKCIELCDEDRLPLIIYGLSKFDKWHLIKGKILKIADDENAMFGHYLYDRFLEGE